MQDSEAVKCPSCGSDEIRAEGVNSAHADHTVRKRKCKACGKTWNTVELEVPTYVCGWERLGPSGQSKPCLRVPVELKVPETV